MTTYAYCFTAYKNSNIVFDAQFYLIAPCINSASDIFKDHFPNAIVTSVKKISDDPMTQYDLREYINKSGV